MINSSEVCVGRMELTAVKQSGKTGKPKVTSHLQTPSNLVVAKPKEIKEKIIIAQKDRRTKRLVFRDREEGWDCCRG